VRRLKSLGAFDYRSFTERHCVAPRLSTLQTEEAMTETENNQPYRRLSRRGTLDADMTLAATLVLATVASAKPAIGGNEAQ